MSTTSTRFRSKWYRYKIKAMLLYNSEQVIDLQYLLVNACTYVVYLCALERPLMLVFAHEMVS